MGNISAANDNGYWRCLVNKIVALLLLIASSLHASQSFGAEKYTIAVVGTGSMGSVLGKRLGGAGHRIIYGSRDPSRKEVLALVEATGHGATVATQREAADQADIIVLAVRWESMEEVIRNIGPFNGQILVDISTAYRQADEGYLELSVENSSELVQRWAPKARVVKTPFGAAHSLENAQATTERMLTYIAADDREAKEVVAGLATQLNLFPLDAGPLRMGKSIDHWSLLYLTPLIQGRALTWTAAPRVAVDYSCISTKGWFRPVKDANNLASFPNQVDFDRQCASRR